MPGCRATTRRRLAVLAAAPSGGPRLYPFGRRAAAWSELTATKPYRDRRGLVAVCEDLRGDDRA